MSHRPAIILIVNSLFSFLPILPLPLPPLERTELGSHLIKLAMSSAGYDVEGQRGALTQGAVNESGVNNSVRADS